MNTQPLVSSPTTTDEERAKNRWAARRASAMASGVAIAEIQALSNGYAEGVAHRRSQCARAARAHESADLR